MDRRTHALFVDTKRCAIAARSDEAALEHLLPGGGTIVHLLGAAGDPAGACGRAGALVAAHDPAGLRVHCVPAHLSPAGTAALVAFLVSDAARDIRNL